MDVRRNREPQSPDPADPNAIVRRRSRSVANRISEVPGEPAGALARQNAADACLRTEHERLQPDTR